MGDFVRRLATAAVLAPTVLLAIFLDPTHWGVVVMAVSVGLISLDEYLRMALPVTPDDPQWLPRGISAAFAIIVIALPSVWSPGVVLPPVLTFGAVVVGLAALSRPRSLDRGGQHFEVMLAGILYIPLLLSVLPLIERAHEADWLTVVLCIAFFSDTAAYVAGRSLGKHKLYPAVSPKKTWEGSLGGIFGGCVATVVVGSWWLIPELPMAHAVGIGVAASALGQVGDLVESLIKRTHGAKDSSNLLPGHGGMLDRVDGLMFVGPVIYYYMEWFGGGS